MSDAHGPDRHDHDHHGHGPGREDARDHEHGSGLPARIRDLVRPHSHKAADKVDAALEASAEGIRALWISLGILGATAVIQAVVVVFSGSVALLGDTLHNFADALTALRWASRSYSAAARPTAATPTATAGPRTSLAS